MSANSMLSSVKIARNAFSAQFWGMYKTALIFLLLPLYLLGQTNINRKLDSMFSTLTAERVFSGSVLVAQNGNIIYQLNAGTENYDTKTNVSSRSRFYLCSLSKVFTATAVLQLQQQGKLNLNDKVQKYFPNLPKSEATIHNLLNHTSGLPDYINDVFVPSWVRQHTPDSLRKIRSNDEVVDSITNNYPGDHFQAGAHFEYINTNYVILASIIEQVSGMSYAEYLSQAIFGPLGMKNSCVYNGPLIPNRALGYRHTFFGDSVQLEDLGILNGVVGDGGVYSTTEDILKFDNAYFHNDLINEQIRQGATSSTDLKKRWPWFGGCVVLILAATVFMLSNCRYKPIYAATTLLVAGALFIVGKIESKSDRTNYGLGWELTNLGAHTVVYHTGGWGAMRNIMWHESSGMTIILLTNNRIFPVFDAAVAISDILNNRAVHPIYAPLATTFCFELERSSSVSSAIDSVLHTWNSLKNNPSRFGQEESDLNEVGYEFLRLRDKATALEIFRLNIRLFPTSWNAYDSFGEALSDAGNIVEAIKAYEQSVQLNPSNTNAYSQIKRLQTRQ